MRGGTEPCRGRAARPGREMQLCFRYAASPGSGTDGGLGFSSRLPRPLAVAAPGVGAVRCQAASACLPGLDGCAVIPASGRQLHAAARSLWSLAPASTFAFGGARCGPGRHATVALARASWLSWLSVKGIGALMGLPSSSNSADRERAVSFASWMPALAAAPTARWQVKAAWCSPSASTTFGMSAVSVSPTCGVPGIDAACWVGASHSRAMLPPTMAAVGPLGALGLLWAWCAQGMSRRASGSGRREMITARPTP